MFVLFFLKKDGVLPVSEKHHVFFLTYFHQTLEILIFLTFKTFSVLTHVFVPIVLKYRV